MMLIPKSGYGERIYPPNKRQKSNNIAKIMRKNTSVFAGFVGE
jgi:hypothetical protein